MKIHNKKEVLEASKAFVRDSMINPVEIVTPKNYAALKDEKSLSPTFEYDTDYLENVVSKQSSIEDSVGCILDNCETESEGDAVLLEFFEDRANDAESSIGIARGILTKDDARTARNSGIKYGFAPPSVIAEAKDRAKNNNYRFDACPRGSIVPEDVRKKLPDYVFDAEGTSRAFREGMNYLGMGEQFATKIDEGCAAIDVRSRSSLGYPVIVIPASKTRKGEEMLSLLAHEIFGHAFSSYNSRMAFSAILGDTALAPLVSSYEKPDDEGFYEGVSKTYDVAVKGEKGLPLPWATIAIELARQGKNFLEVAEELFEMRRKSGVTDERARELAWTTTYRVFRGATDPNNNADSRYVFGKDAAYFWGYKLALEFKDRPYFASRSTLKVEEIEKLSEIFPTFKEVPQQFDLEKFVNHMIGYMLG